MSCFYSASTYDSRIGRILKNIIYSKARLMVWLRAILALAFIVLVTRWFSLLFIFLDPKLVQENLHLMYFKDILADYIVIRGFLAGWPINTPLNILAKELLNHSVFFPHPLPHPPPVVLLTFPLGYLQLEIVVYVWIAIQLFALFASVFFLLKCLDQQPTGLKIGLLVVLLLGWHPFIEDLLWENFSIILLLLTLVGWYSLKKGRDLWAGFFLGLGISIKLFLWPVLVFLLLKRNWRASIMGFLTISILNLIALLTFGFDAIAGYYFRISDQVLPYYQAYSFNYSLSTIGWRLFSGTYSSYVAGVVAPPLIHRPELAGWFSLVVQALFLGICLLYARLSYSNDLAFGFMICVSLLISPVFWNHYFVLMIIPISLLGLQLCRQSLPDNPTIIFLLIIGLMFIPQRIFTNGIEMIGGVRSPDGNLLVSFPLSLISLVPTLEVLGLALMIINRFRMRGQTIAKDIFVEYKDAKNP